MIQSYVDYFDSIGINLTPAGIWEYIPQDCDVCEDADSECPNCHGETQYKKRAIDANRVDNLSWTKYPDDNLGRHFIESNTVVIDIDGASVSFSDDRQFITLIDLDITIPIGFYTITKYGSYHLYYTSSKLKPMRLIKLFNTDIDVISYGVMFEGHPSPMSPQVSRMNNTDIGPIELPEEMLSTIYRYVEMKKIRSIDKSRQKYPTSNRVRAKLVQSYIEGNLTERKDLNALYRSVFPQSAIPHNAKSIKLKDITFSYQFFNNTMYKVALTAELGFHEHIIPLANKLLTEFGLDPDSDETDRRLHRQIFATIPQHVPLLPYDPRNDEATLEEYVAAQPDAKNPLFKVRIMGTIRYMEIDRFSLEPILSGDSVLFDEKAARDAHPELDIVDNNGRVIGWDQSRIPTVLVTNDPYQEPYFLDVEADMWTINLSIRTPYIKQVSQLKYVPEDNILYKMLRSSIHPSYFDIVMAYYAYVFFDTKSPNMILWMGSAESQVGGAGKSIITLELPSLILGASAAQIDAKTFSSGWGDVQSGSRLISLEDMPLTSKNAWSPIYAAMKQMNSNSVKKLNMKYGGMKATRMKMAITGSSNFRPPLDPSDRRFLCLEPAFHNGETKSLSESERRQLNEIFQDHTYREEVQEFTDYVYSLYVQGIPEDILQMLFVQAPETKYKMRWVEGASTNTQAVIHNLRLPNRLLDMVRISSNWENETVINLLKYIIHVYSESTMKVHISWRWFAELLPLVQTDFQLGHKFTKSGLERAMKVDFGDAAITYTDKWKKYPLSEWPAEWSSWPESGYTIQLSDDIIEQYRKIIEQQLEQTYD